MNKNKYRSIIQYLRRRSRLGLDPGAFCWVSFLKPTYDILPSAVDPTPGSEPNKHIKIDFPLTLILWVEPKSYKD